MFPFFDGEWTVRTQPDEGGGLKLLAKCLYSLDSAPVTNYLRTPYYSANSRHPFATKTDIVERSDAVSATFATWRTQWRQESQSTFGV
jgi:hypothetical protein